MYKRQVQDLQSKVADETKRADKVEFETKRSQEKISALQREKEVMILNGLTSKIEENQVIWRRNYYKRLFFSATDGGAGLVTGNEWRIDFV